MSDKHTPVHACNLDGKKLSWQPETSENPASIGMICAWGGFTVADIHDDVPCGEANEYAQKLCDRYNHHAELVEALRKAINLADDYHRLIHDAVGYGEYKPCDEVEALKSTIAKLDTDQ